MFTKDIGDTSLTLIKEILKRERVPSNFQKYKKHCFYFRKNCFET